jgi:hypothetical protein
MKNCINGTHPDGLYPSYRNGKIGLSPKNDITEKLAEYFSGFNYLPKYFDTKE